MLQSCHPQGWLLFDNGLLLINGLEIIKSIAIIDALPPGLYEMIIVNKGKKEGMSNYDVSFNEYTNPA